MKFAIIGFAALVIGVGGGAFLSGSKVKDQILEEAALAASIEHAAAEADGQGDDAAPDSTAHGEGASEGSVTLDMAGPEDAQQHGAEEGGTAPAEIAADSSEHAAPGFDIAGAQRLSKIFGAMQAPDAAEVLTEMSDDEVKAILTEMSDRLAAAILGEFAPARAAELSRVVLNGGASN